MTAYESLISQVWLQKVRTSVKFVSRYLPQCEVILISFFCISNDWNPREFSSLIWMIERWQPALPVFIFDSVVTQLIMPKLTAAIDAWNPRKDPAPVHSWILPWLPLVGARTMEPLWIPIRHRLGIILADWEAEDPSGLILVRPWKDVFKEEEFQSFLQKHIVPKLAFSLSQFVINPRDQQLESFQSVVAWRQIVPVNDMAKLFDQYFFPNWLRTLRMWLQEASSPNYEEIIRWHQGWKSLFPAELLAHPLVKEKFVAALEIMNAAVRD